MEIKRPWSIRAPEEEQEEEDGEEDRDEEDVGRSDLLTDADGPKFVNRLYRDDGVGKLLSKWNSTVRSAFAVYATEVDEDAGRLYRTVLNE